MVACFACEEVVAAAPEAQKKKKKKKKKGTAAAVAKKSWRVQLSDTVIFPVGGGQPADFGTISSASGALVAAVTHAERDAEGVIWHTTDAPVPVSVEADYVVAVDWLRRFDHMQQHTAQHLISAIASRAPFNARTLSWALSSPSCGGCTIDFDSAALATDVASARALEAAVNSAVRAARQVVPRVAALDASAAAGGAGDVAAETAVSGGGAPSIARESSKAIALQGVRQMRTVEIEGVDSNKCCGTHVAHLGELQAVSFRSLKTTGGGSGAQLVFLAGDRLLRQLQSCFRVEESLTKALSCAPADFAGLVAKSQASAKQRERELKAMRAKLAAATAQSLAAEAAAAAAAGAEGEARAPCVLLARHVSDEVGDLKFAQEVVSAAAALDLGSWVPRGVVVLTVGDAAGDSGGAGSFIVAGAVATGESGDSGGASDSALKEAQKRVDARVAAAGRIIAEAVGGGGGGRNGRFQGKAKNLAAWDDAARDRVREAMAAL